jgi:flagellar biosynthesis/type III secretory pathway chaperone
MYAGSQNKSRRKKVMVEFLDELLGILRVETELYRRLLEIMRRERPALLRSCRTEIDAVSAEKRDLIERLQAAGRRRAEVIDHLSRHWGRSPADVTLSWITRTSPEPLGAEFRHARSELLGLMARIQEENHRSEVLCRHVGELLRTAYGVLKGLAANGSIYHRGGRLERARLNGKLVCDEI